MAQEIINTGAAANDGTGDPLRTAFIKTDNNFDQIWTAGPVGSNVRIAGNTITTLQVNQDLVLAPNGVSNVRINNNTVPNANNIWYLGSATNRWRGVYVGAAGLDVTGNITAAYVTVNNDLAVNGNLIVDGDVIQIGNIITDAKTIQLANTAATDAQANGSGVTVGANDDVATLLYNSTDDEWRTNIGANIAGNVTADYFIGNGALLTGVTSYTNANAIALGESGWSGNIIPSANAVYSLGNATNYWSNLFVASNTIFIGGVPLGITGNTLTVNGEPVLSNDSDASISTTGSITAETLSANSSIDIGGASLLFDTDTNDLVFETVPPGGFRPSNDDLYTLGNVSHRWSNLYVYNISAVSEIEVGGNVFVDLDVSATRDISAGGNVSANYFIGDGSQLTGISTSFDLEMHVSKDGNDSTGTGTILRPYLTITHALTQVTGGRNTIVIHPGGYTENPTITSLATQLITYDATGASTLVYGTVTIANTTGRIAGLKMTNLAITGNAQAYINSSTVDEQFTKSSSGYVEVDDCELQTTGNVLISGSGITTIIGNKIANLVVNNAGAQVLVKGANDCVMPRVTAGSLNIVDSVIRASSNTANAVTASAGTVVTLMNNQIVTPAADSVARVSIAGFHSIISVVYDKANSTLSNSLNSVAYFQTANVDSLVSSGNVTGGNLLTAGLISATGNVTANYFIGDGSQLTDISVAPGNVIENGDSNVAIAAPNGNVTISANTATWNFGTDSVLTVPGNTVTSTLYTDNNGYRLNLEGNLNGVVAAKLVLDNDSGFIRLVVGNVSTPAIWAFRDDGNLTVAGNINFGGDSSAAPSLNDFASITSAANFAVTIDSADSAPTWRFETGDSALGEFDESPVLRTPVGAGSVIYNETLMAILAGNIDAGERSSVRLQEGGVSLLGTTSLDGELSTIIMEVNTGGVGIRALGDAAPRLSVVGNVTGGNILTAGSVTANGNVAGGNINTAGAVSATGNLSANNISTGNVTATRVQNDANLEIRSNVVGTIKNWTFDTLGDLNLPFGGNIVGSGGISANTGTFTGNVTAANFEGNISITGNVTGTSANVDLVAGAYEWSFDNTGNLTLPGNTFAVNYANNTPVDVVTRFEGTWTVPTGNSTQSFTVDGNHTYQMWVEGNIPNGIIAWNALVTVTNTNVPVLGQQFAWNYEGGGNVLLLTSIPNQIVGTAGTISNAAPVVTNTNVFSFGINNASGSEQSIRYGWIQIS